MFGSIWGAIAGIIVSLQTLSPIVIFFAFSGGFAIALFIHNEITSKRLMKRLQTGNQEGKIQKENIPKPDKSDIKYLLDMVKSDIEDLSKSICIAHASGHYSEFDTAPFRIRFKFEVFNGSFFSITIDSIEGYIVFLGKKLNRPPQLEKMMSYVPRCQKGNFTVHQYLEQEEVKMMLDLKKQSESIPYYDTESFNFEKAKLWVVADDLEIKDKKYLLPLGKIPFK